MSTVRFDQLVTGDRIYWAGAADDAAEVTQVRTYPGHGRRRVTIAWHSDLDDKDHASELTWEDDQAVHLDD